VVGGDGAGRERAGWAGPEQLFAALLACLPASVLSRRGDGQGGVSE
jgi:hypothetical protein